MPHEICPQCLGAFYKHCGNAGQAKCGRTLATARRSRFKRAFEIGIIGKSANVNSFHAPQGSRHFARARPAIRRRTLLSYGSVGAGRKRS
jgi:hypothetical protein